MIYLNGDWHDDEGEDEKKGMLFSPAIGPQYGRPGYCLKIDLIHNGTNSANLTVTQRFKEETRPVFNGAMINITRTNSITKSIHFRSFEITQVP